MRIVLAAGLALALPLLPIAWQDGYRTWNLGLCLGMALAVWGLAAVVGERVNAGDGRAGSLVRTAVLAIAVIVLMGFVLSGVREMTALGYGTASLAVALVALWLRRRRRVQRPVPWRVPRIWIGAVALASALGALALGFALTHAPLTLYDAPSYHLYFAARWLQDHAISILPTPFSDEAQSYAPANGELVLLWLMAPWHGDFLARAGQWPFWWLGALAVYAIARRLGAARAHACYPALFFLVARPVIEQAVGADVDLIAAALFASAIYLGLVAVERDTWVEWTIWGIAVGLTVGTKYVLLIYLPILLTIPVVGGLRRRALWATPGLVVFGAPWYLRNWIVAGSPIYPASLQIAGTTLAQGAFTRAAMLNTVFHTSDFRLAPAILAHGFGVTLAMIAWPLGLLGAVMMRRRWWPEGWLVSIPIVMAALFWFVLPVNIDSRFFLPAVAPALVPLALAFRTSRLWNAILHALCVVGLGWILIGLPHSLSMQTPWYMAGWLELNGIISSSSLGLFGLLALALGGAWWMASKTRWVVPLVAVLAASTGTVLAQVEDTRCAPARCDRLHVTDPDIRPGLLRTWEWMDDHVHDATVAYTGINLPYPAAGPHLTNRVVYVNIDGHLGWRFHDYDRAYRAGRFQPIPPALAISSGELEPVPAGTGPRPDASRPRYERLEGFPELWLRNLRLLGVQYVFVARLSAYEVDYQVHDASGFPIEDAWAQAAPAIFTRVFDDQDARLYAVARAERTP